MSYQMTDCSIVSTEIIFVGELSVGELSVGEMPCRRNVRNVSEISVAEMFVS